MLLQWVVWRRELVNGRETKVPWRADGNGRASSADPATWSDYATACAAVERYGFDGVGFVVTAADDIVGGDLDGCRDPESGRIHPVALDIITRFATYTEVSPSQRGVRFFGRAWLPPDHPCRTGKIELYSRGRYFTVTGDHLDGTPETLANITEPLHWLFSTFFVRRAEPSANLQKVGRVVHRREDHDVIERALQARNGSDFARLWSGDWQGAGYGSQSEADLALLSHLAYWTDADAAQMARLFEQSGLCRPKWLERSDYRTRTLTRALAGVGHA